MAHCAVPLKFRVVGVQITKYRAKEIDNHRPVVIEIISYSLTKLVLKQMCTDGANSANSDTLGSQVD